MQDVPRAAQRFGTGLVNQPLAERDLLNTVWPQGRRSIRREDQGCPVRGVCEREKV
jgi:hypothetical protein